MASSRPPRTNRALRRSTRSTAPFSTLAARCRSSPKQPRPKTPATRAAGADSMLWRRSSRRSRHPVDERPRREHLPRCHSRRGAVVYGAAMRTPLVRVDMPGRTDGLELYLKLEVLQPIGSFKIRGAYQRRPPADAGGARRRRLDSQRRQRRAGRRLCGAPSRRAVLGDGHGHGAGSEDRRHRTARRVDRPRHLRRMLADGRAPRLRSHARLLRPSVRRRPVHRRKRHGWRSKFSKTCPTSMPSSRRSAAAGCCRASPRPRAHCGRRRRVFAAEPETAAPLSASLAGGRPVYFENWRASFVDGAGGKSVLETMWPLLRGVSRIDRRHARRGGPGDAARRRAGARHCRRRGRLRGRRRAQRPRRHGKVVAIVSGGNIDLSRFASPRRRRRPAPQSRFHRPHEPLLDLFRPARHASRASTSSPSICGGAGTEARAVFRRLDYALWRATAHNPVRMLWVDSAREARRRPRAIPSSSRSTTAPSPRSTPRARRATPGGRNRRFPS